MPPPDDDTTSDDRGSCKRRRRKLATVLGCMLLNMPAGIDWYWGGMSVYALSYVVTELQQTSGVETPWVISLFLIFMTFGIVVSDLLAIYIPRRLLLIVSSILMNAFLFASYFSIQYSLAMVNLTMGVLTGFSVGVMYGNTIYFAVDVADKDAGFLSSFMPSSHSLGGFAIIEIITRYINPRNKTPNLAFGSTKYFTQTDIIAKTPSMFLILGLYSVAMHIAAFVLLQFNPNIAFLKGCLRDNPDIKLRNNTSFEEVISPQKSCNHSEETSCLDPCDVKNECSDYTPKEMIKTPLFYSLCASFCMGGVSLILMFNYYKLYGQVWISDDHFLSETGMAFVFVTSLSKAPWGLAVDRLGARRTLISLLVCVAIITSFFCFTALIDKWLYLFATIVYGGFIGAMYSVHLSVTAYLFGKKYVATNFGLLISVFALFNFIVPYIIEEIVTHFGWFTMFLSASCLDIFSVILCLIFVP